MNILQIDEQLSALVLFALATSQPLPDSEYTINDHSIDAFLDLQLMYIVSMSFA